METRSAKRKKFWFEGESRVDRITDLPDVIIHHILFFLPIKTIAKTSVLSKRWRSLWISLPDLDFTSIGDSPTDIEPRNDERFSLPCNSLSSSKRMDFISQVLDLRNKHSDLRVLRFCAPLSFSHLNGLIRRAIKQNVQELDVEVATHDYFNFPRSVLTSESLRVFKLRSRYPGFRLPPSMILKGGFRSLQSLSLSLVILHNQRRLSDLFTDSSFPRLKMLNLNAFSGLEHLKVSCLALEDLTLENCYQLLALDVSGAKLKKLRVAACFTAFFYKSWVKINAPSLRTLDWECNGINRTSSLENLTSLKEASIGFNVVTGDESLSELQSVSSLLSALSQINCLTLANLGFEILSNKKYVSNVMLSFNNLKSLEIVTGFNKHNVAGLAHLFKSSPTLHSLILRIIYDHKIDRTKWNKDLWAMPTTEEQFWESQTQTLNSFLNHLCVVKIYGFLEYVNEVSLAKFLLKHGKALQEIIISPGHCNYRDSLRRQKFRSQMMGFSRASSKAKIDFV